MEHSEPSDAELVAETLAGDREAFGHLYDRYARLVRAVVWPSAGDWPMTHDLTQETFLRAYRNLSRLKDPGRVGAWVVGIARRVARERRRSLRRQRQRFIADPLETDRRFDGVGQVDADDEFDFIMQKLATLDERERLAIHSFFLEQRDARRSGELLGLSRSGLYALLGRAVARLAALVGPGEPGEKKR